MEEPELLQPLPASRHDEVITIFFTLHYIWHLEEKELIHEKWAEKEATHFLAVNFWAPVVVASMIFSAVDDSVGQEMGSY